MKCLPSMWGWVGGRHSGEEGGAEEGRKEGHRTKPEFTHTHTPQDKNSQNQTKKQNPSVASILADSSSPPHPQAWPDQGAEGFWHHSDLPHMGPGCSPGLAHCPLFVIPLSAPEKMLARGGSLVFVLCLSLFLWSSDTRPDCQGLQDK